MYSVHCTLQWSIYLRREIKGTDDVSGILVGFDMCDLSAFDSVAIAASAAGATNKSLQKSGPVVVSLIFCSSEYRRRSKSWSEPVKETNRQTNKLRTAATNKLRTRETKLCKSMQFL